MKVALITLATGKYDQFVLPLITTCNRYFLGGIATYFVLTDREEPIDSCVTLKAEHRPWPYPTLYRWHQILKHQEQFKDYDYLYHIDVDMRCVANVGTEILRDSVGTLSPVGFDWPKRSLPFERNPASAAYVPEGQGERYHTGAFNGGRTDTVLAMASAIAAGVDADEEIGYVARMHEESHLNKYYFDHPPEVTLLPSYCYPEKVYGLGPFPKIIVTIDKPYLDKEKSASMPRPIDK